MRAIDLTTLRYLVAVCDLQNIARAADQEHIAPSAISKRIAALEATLGVPLLIRTRRGVAQTPACEALLERARTILYEAAQIESDMNAFGGGLQGQLEGPYAREVLFEKHEIQLYRVVFRQIIEQRRVDADARGRGHRANQNEG